MDNIDRRILFAIPFIVKDKDGNKHLMSNGIHMCNLQFGIHLMCVYTFEGELLDMTAKVVSFT